MIRRGVQVTRLTGGPSAIPGIPHVTGVRTSGGEELRADLVVDAMGRRSRGCELLSALGAREPHAEAEDSGSVYYTRHFTGPSRPVRLGPPLVPIGTISLLTLDGDNDTWSVTVFSATGDAPLKALREGRPWSPANSLMSRLANAAPYGADVFRAFLETRLCLALPQEVIQRPGVKDTAEQLGHQAPPPAPGPGRQQLLRLLST